MRFQSGENHGFIKLEIAHDGARAEFTAVDTIESRNYNAFVKAAFDIEKGAGSARFTKTEGLGFRQGILF